MSVLGGAVLGGFAAAVVLAVLLAVSPASFVSLLPDWFADDGLSRATAWLVTALCAVAAAALALLHGRGRRLRAALITLLLLAAAGFGLHGLTGDPAPPPDHTCVAYSGGHHTCPGG